MRESLIERERLLRIAPHLVRPMQFILPHVPGLRPRWQIRFGLFFYDYFSGRRTLQPSRSVRIGSGGYGALRPGIDHAFAYSDCWVDDSRLVVLNALDAAQRGAAIHTRTRFVSAAAENGVWRARCVRQAQRRIARDPCPRDRQCGRPLGGAGSEIACRPCASTAACGS